jgi:outer membrane receptor protein involved in Fe transport
MAAILRLSLVLGVTVAVALGYQSPGQTASGTIAGGIFDAANGKPVPHALIELQEGPKSKVLAGSDGKYQLDAPPGTYSVRISAPNYVSTVLDSIVVTAGHATEASSVLPLVGSGTTVNVVEKVDAVAATAEAALLERKLAPVVSDAISSQEIRDSIASDAAGAVEKVAGVSIVDNGMVYVRGLGERYSATMLNNAIIPTTEPEKRVVPLDLFPASLIDNIKVLKTYSADLPGEFSGGLVQMQTVDFPMAKALSVSITSGFNTNTSFDRFNSFRGGSLDWTGFGGDSRQLPSIIPSDQRLFVGNFTPEQFQQFGQALAPDYETRPIGSMRPSLTYSVAGGNSFGKIGIVGALTFTNTPQRYPEMRRFLVNSGGGRPQVFSDYPEFNSDTESARLGAVFNIAYKLNATNKLIWRNTLTRDSDKEARVFSGLNGGNGNLIQSTRLRYIERSLMSTGVEGDHAIQRFGSGVFHWQFTYSRSQRDEPDLRETIYGRDEGSTQYRFLNLPESGLRFFSELGDRIYEPQADWTKPFYKGSVTGLLKVGFRATVRRRDFEGRRFRFFPVRAQTIDFNQSANQVLGPANIRPDGFVVREITRATDTYGASMDIYGGYVMTDLNLGRRWRVISGVRIEDADILVTTIDPLIPGGIPSYARLSNRDPLPAVNLIYAITSRQNLRFGYGRTVNRPDFRELSPFEFTNVVGGYSTVGNPDLQRATIDNFDVRWEWFLGGNQVLAASYFFKNFTDPIEQIYRPTASELRQSFLNVAGARNQGVELEARKSLRFIHPRLSGLAVQTNLTFVDSNVQIPTDRFPQLTSRTRPLVGQSRFIYNIVSEWAQPRLHSTVRLYVNSVSRRITDVGTFQLPDVYQERTTFVDAVYKVTFDEQGRWSMRFSAENMTDNKYRYTQADFLVRAFQIGRTYSVGLNYSFF